MPFDFAEILDATEDVTVNLRNKPVVCSIYVTGYERIHHNDQVRLAELSDQAVPVQQRIAEINAELELLNGDKPERRAELRELLRPLQRENRENTIKMAQALVPLAVKEWKHEGEPLSYHGDCPPSECHRLPDDFISEVAARAGEVWDARQKKEPRQFGSELLDNPNRTSEEAQAESITPSSD